MHYVVKNLAGDYLQELVTAEDGLSSYWTSERRHAQRFSSINDACERIREYYLVGGLSYLVAVRVTGALPATQRPSLARDVATRHIQEAVLKTLREFIPEPGVPVAPGSPR